MTDNGPLTVEAILQATEEVLRKYGPAKATVVDVARVLGVSHGSVYRHFGSKLALREAVTARWLDKAHSGLADIAAGDEPAAIRLASWIRALSEAKKRKAFDDPELFRTYRVLVEDEGASAVVEEHLAALVSQLARIVSDGRNSGEFTVEQPETAALAIFNATVAFHAPVFADRWSQPQITAELDAVIGLILSGLQTR